MWLDRTGGTIKHRFYPRDMSCSAAQFESLARQSTNASGLFLPIVYLLRIYARFFSITILYFYSLSQGDVLYEWCVDRPRHSVYCQRLNMHTRRSRSSHPPCIRPDAFICIQRLVTAHAPVDLTRMLGRPVHVRLVQQLG